MPAQKSSAADGSAKAKASSSGTATPVSVSEKKDLSDPQGYSGGRPDKKAYDAEQQSIKSEIDDLQVKLSAVRDKISLATKSGSGNDRRNALRAELDGIRDQQASIKASRGKIHDQMRALQDTIQKKAKDLQAAKSKISFKNVAEVDSHIQYLEKKVESGTMKLAEEKRALQEISANKRNRRIVEGFQADQDAIDTDRLKVDELKRRLDDPESKAVSERYDKIKAELDELKKESDEAYAGRSKLFAERDDIQAELNALFNRKRESAQLHREANDRYWAKVNEDRARRAERLRQQKADEEAARKQEVAQRLREEAEAPAYQAEIEDCQTLIDYLSGNNTSSVTYKSSSPLSSKPELIGVPKLEIRKVEDAPDGAVIRKKKGEDEESYFVGGKGKKGKKGAVKATSTAEAPTPSAATASTAGPLNVPLPTLSALLTLSIPPPTANDDIKKAWFEANQARITAENIAKAEAEIQRLTNGLQEAKIVDTTTSDISPPNGGGERPAEPASTPQVGDVPSVPVPSEEVVDKLEAVNEQEDS
ncbi:hypothetical protein BDQ17DRAFT_1349438 [Cyathus striatus]|nr:hypothetical protein BDQ17DRAFT_1349438 [Cyathus striatus]